MDAPTARLTGKVALVTGATSGIGLVVAEQLAARGARVLAAGRDRAKAARVAAGIRSRRGDVALDFLFADLSSLAEVDGLAGQVKDATGRLDILVNNAGALFWKRGTTVDGYERTFALNHLAPFLLTRELLPLLRASAPARVVNVASGTHARTSLDLDDLMGEKRWNGRQAYARSKLCNVLFTYELSRRVSAEGIAVNCTRPGFVRTGFAHNNAWWVKAGVWIAQLFGRSPAQGAHGTVYLASSPEAEGVTAKYYKDEQALPSSPESHDEALARKLWESSEALVDKALARA